MNMRNKLNKEDKKVTIAFCLNPILAKKFSELHKNKSKQIEWLIYQYLLKENHIEEMPL